MEHSKATVPHASDPRWRAALQAVIDDPALRSLHAQPVVELSSGRLAGFELLSRFVGPWQTSPDRWFSAAEHWGLNARLQGQVLRAAVASRAELPPNTFLTVNIEPHLLTLPDVAGVLTGIPDLSRIVLELTEHTELIGDAAYEVLRQVRSAGALLAMDDAGTGYAGLSKLLTLRPDIVKLDWELITGVDVDPVKRGLVEVFGDLAGRMDAWILAEGIETVDELDVLIGLGVPLGQGFVLARPAAEMIRELPEEIASHIRSTAARTSLRDHIASLIRPATVGSQTEINDVLLAEDGRAARVRLSVDLADPSWDRWVPAMTVAPGAAPRDVALRAMAREEADRFAPLVCTDGRGNVLGLIRMDDLMTALGSSSSLG